MIRPTIYSFVLGTMLLTITPAQAQGEYFTQGEQVIGVGGFLLREDGVRGSGLQLEGMVSSRVAFSFGIGQTNVEAVRDVDAFDEDAYDLTSWSLGAAVYAGRQGVDGPLTIRAGLNVGRTTVGQEDGDGGIDEVGAIVLSPSVGIAHMVTPPEAPFAVVPNIGGAVTLLLAEPGADAAFSLGLGVGLGIRFAPTFVLAFEPGLSFVFEQENTRVGRVGLLSLNFAY